MARRWLRRSVCHRRSRYWLSQVRVPEWIYNLHCCPAPDSTSMFACWGANITWIASCVVNVAPNRKIFTIHDDIHRVPAADLRVSKQGLNLLPLLCFFAKSKANGVRNDHTPGKLPISASSAFSLPYVTSSILILIDN